jgi:molybdopterin-binding protein
MPLSARNHLKGEVTDVLLGTVTALITVKVGNDVIESVITTAAQKNSNSRRATR